MGTYGKADIAECCLPKVAAVESTRLAMTWPRPGLSRNPLTILGRVEWFPRRNYGVGDRRLGRDKTRGVTGSRCRRLLRAAARKTRQGRDVRRNWLANGEKIPALRGSFTGAAERCVSLLHGGPTWPAVPGGVPLRREMDGLRKAPGPRVIGRCPQPGKCSCGRAAMRPGTTTPNLS